MEGIARHLVLVLVVLGFSPTVYADSLDHSVVFRASRYEDGEGDYLNVPLDRGQYEAFVSALLEQRLLIEDGQMLTTAGPLPTLAVPATLQDSLEARLDRLASVKNIAQIGSVIGREFRYDLLAPSAIQDSMRPT